MTTSHPLLSSMGRLIAPALAVMPLLWACIPAVARAEGTATPHVQSPHQRITVDDRVKRLSSSLALTPEQEAKVRAILVRRQTALERLRVEPSISAVDRVHQFRVLDLRAVDQIKGVLTEEQLKKYAPGQPQPRSPVVVPPNAPVTPSAESAL